VSTALNLNPRTFPGEFNSFLLSELCLDLIPQTLVNHHIGIDAPYQPYVTYSSYAPDDETFIAYHSFVHIPNMPRSGSRRLGQRYIAGDPPEQAVLPSVAMKNGSGRPREGFFKTFLNTQLVVETSFLLQRSGGGPALAGPLMAYAIRNGMIDEEMLSQMGSLPAAISHLRGKHIDDTSAAVQAFSKSAAELVRLKKFTAAAMIAELAAYSLVHLLSMDVKEMDLERYMFSDGGDRFAHFGDSLTQHQAAAAKFWLSSLDEYDDPGSYMIRLLHGLINAYYGASYPTMRSLLERSGEYCLAQKWPQRAADESMRIAWTILQGEKLSADDWSEIHQAITFAVDTWWGQKEHNRRYIRKAAEFADAALKIGRRL